MILMFFGTMIAATLIYFALLKIAEYTDDSVDSKMLVVFWIVAMFMLSAGAAMEGLI